MKKLEEKKNVATAKKYIEKNEKHKNRGWKMSWDVHSGTNKQALEDNNSIW